MATQAVNLQTVVNTVVERAIPALTEQLASTIDSRIEAALQRQGQHGGQTQGQVPASVQSATVTAVPPVVGAGQGSLGAMPSAGSLAGVGTFGVSESNLAQVNPAVASPLTTQVLATSAVTPIPAVVPVSLQPTAAPSETIAVGGSTPPVPKRLCEKIWRGEFVDMQDLLPSRLGLPEPTLLDLVVQAKRKQLKGITCIEQWVTSFNLYISIMALRHPQRVIDLLSYSSLIVKACRDYEPSEDKPLPWLAYDTHFRKIAAARKLATWADRDGSLWALYFTGAVPRAICADCGEMGHFLCRTDKETEPLAGRQADRPARGKKEKKSGEQARFSPYPRPNPICKNWNGAMGCTEPRCSYQHICLECHEKHPAMECSIARRRKKGSQQGVFRPRQMPTRN